MKKFFRIISPLLLILILYSCFKKDEMVPAHPKGNVTTDTIAMTDTYKYQVYYNLDQAKKTGTNLRKDGDLAFECSDTGWKVILSTGNFMKIADIGEIALGLPAEQSPADQWRKIRQSVSSISVSTMAGW